MFGFVFKSSLYYMIWNKFKSQFITLLASIILVVAIFSIYEDLHIVLKISDKERVFGLFLLKWFLISLIFGYNWYSFKKLKLKSTDNHKKYQENEPIPKQQQNILNKQKLKTKTDVILQKYLKKD